MSTNYILGLLAGDGHFQLKDGRDLFCFSTTNEESVQFVREFLNFNNYNFIDYIRNHSEEQKKRYGENRRDLHIIEIKDERFLEYLKTKGFDKNNRSKNIQDDPDFIRGYLESKGTFFEGFDGKYRYFKMAFSGNKEEVERLNDILTKRGVVASRIAHRKEKVNKGVVSNSYRLPIQNRKSISTMLNWIKGEPVTKKLKDKFELFEDFEFEKDYRITKSYVRYKQAVKAMSDKLEIEIKGIYREKQVHTENERFNNVYLWDGSDQIAKFKGWKGAYEWVSDVYKDEFGFDAPEVKESEDE